MECGEGLPARAKALGQTMLEEHRGGLCVWSRGERGGEVREGTGRLCRASWAWGRTWAFSPGNWEPWRAVGRGGAGPDLGAPRLSHSGRQTVGREAPGQRGLCGSWWVGLWLRWRQE